MQSVHLIFVNIALSADIVHAQFVIAASEPQSHEKRIYFMGLRLGGRNDTGITNVFRQRVNCNISM